MSGCRTCAHARRVAGEAHCAKRPHDVETEEQRAIADWLRVSGRVAWSDDGCPSYTAHEGDSMKMKPLPVWRPFVDDCFPEGKR